MMNVARGEPQYRMSSDSDRWRGCGLQGDIEKRAGIKERKRGEKNPCPFVGIHEFWIPYFESDSMTFSMICSLRFFMPNQTTIAIAAPRPMPIPQKMGVMIV